MLARDEVCIPATPRVTAAWTALAIATSTAMGMGLRHWLASSLDRTAMRGPAGVKAIHALTEGNTGRDWFTWLGAVVQPLVGGHEVAATELAVSLGAAAGLVGAGLAGAVLAGPWGAFGAGLLAATWVELVFPALVIGGDAPGTGLAWLGLGLAWLGAREGRAGLLLVAPAAFLVVFGAGVKQTALPTAAFLGLLPFLVPDKGRLWRVPLVCALGAAGLWTGRSSILSRAEAQVDKQESAIAFGDLGPALNELVATVQVEPRMQVLGLFTGLALAGVLLPGRLRLARLVLAVLAAIVLVVVQATLGEAVRPRYFAPASFGLLVLGGAAFGLLAPLLRRLAPASGALALGVAAVLAVDTTAFVSGWWHLVQRYEQVGPNDLPAVPEQARRRHERLDRVLHSDHSAVGAHNLVRLVQDAPDGGVATVPLRDAREHHLLAAAGVAGRKGLILDPAVCCDSPRPDGTCAREVVAALDEAGVLLLLPTEGRDLSRFNRHDPSWTRLLATAAGDRGELATYGQYWRTWQGSGTGGPLPCQRRSEAPPVRHGPGSSRPR